MRSVEGVVHHGRAGPEVYAVERAAPGVEIGRRERKEPRQAGGVERAPRRDGVEPERKTGEKSLPLAEREGVELSKRRGEVGPGPLGRLLEGCLVLRMQRDGQGGVKEPLPSPLHLVAQPRHVLKGDLRLRGHRAPPPERQALRRLETHLLPLQGAGRLLRRYGAEMNGEIHRRACGHEALKESRRERPRPFAEVEGAHEGVADAHVSAVDLYR